MINPRRPGAHTHTHKSRSEHRGAAAALAAAAAPAFLLTFSSNCRKCLGGGHARRNGAACRHNTSGDPDAPPERRPQPSEATRSRRATMPPTVGEPGAKPDDAPSSDAPQKETTSGVQAARGARAARERRLAEQRRSHDKQASGAGSERSRKRHQC